MINVSKLYCGLAGQSDYLRYENTDSLGPIVVYNCTSRCNLRCLHCYSSSQSNQNNNELSTSEAKKLLSQLAEVNCPVVLFSGGEPLLRNDLFELLFEAKKLGLRSVLSTNGTLIDSAAADRLAEAGVKYVGISIDGEEKFHDRFRNVKGSFKSALKGIENCSRAGVKPGLRFTITKSNCGEITAVFDIAASAGVRRICFYHLIRTGRAKKLQDEALKPEQTRTAVDTIIEKTGDFVKKDLIDEVLTVGNHADGPYVLTRMIREKSKHYETAKELLLANGGNKTGEKIICVGWDGNVYPDQFWRNYSLGNVKDKTFKQIRQNSDEPVLNMLRNKHKFADDRCKKCKWFDLCKGNFRFSGNKSGIECWRNEPACYLRDDEIFQWRTCMGFPEIRMRRLRSSDTMRRLVRQTNLSVDNLVYPLFVRQGKGSKKPIESMSGCFHFSPDTAAEEAAEVASLGIPAVLLFGLPAKKDDKGSDAWSENGAVQQAVRKIKKAVPELLVITDVCLCAYTNTGHCGVIKNGKINNDATCELIAKTALSHAQAGADIVAPSDMMDGRVKYIREALEQNNFHDTAIMAYSAKYASAFYGPFRDAAESAPTFGDRKSYQMDPANSNQAMQEIALDIEEGADIVMVKPALCFLDIICRARERFDCPIAAYNVSGEYMMLNKAAEAGLLDKNAAMTEMLASIKRAGADIIITYFAKEAAKQLNKK